MASKMVRVWGATVAGLLSIGGMVWSLVPQFKDANFIATTTQAQFAPLPSGLIPRGTQQSKALSLDAGEQMTLRAAMWRDPLNPKLFNLVYANSVRVGRPKALIERQVAILGKLGWRYTPAQQNLLFRNLLDAKFVDAIDRADALLRRQKLPSLAFAMLNTMEAIPQVHDVIVDRLRSNPKWRHDYLGLITSQSAPALLDVRSATLAALSRGTIGIGRDELAPSLTALIATGRGRAAYTLWIRRGIRQIDSNLVYDPDFRQAMMLVGSSSMIPFEWHLSQDVNYSVQPSSEGVLVNWDRRGVPAFLSQVVPVYPGRGYALTVQGTSDGGDLQSALAPALVCGTISVPMTAAEGREARYLTGSLPQACDMGTLIINGAVDSGAGTVNLTLKHVNLQRIS